MQICNTHMSLDPLVLFQMAVIYQAEEHQMHIGSLFQQVTHLQLLICSKEKRTELDYRSMTMTISEQ